MLQCLCITSIAICFESLSKSSQFIEHYRDGVQTDLIAYLTPLELIKLGSIGNVFGNSDSVRKSRSLEIVNKLCLQHTICIWNAILLNLPLHLVYIAHKNDILVCHLLTNPNNILMKQMILT